MGFNSCQKRLLCRRKLYCNSYSFYPDLEIKIYKLCCYECTLGRSKHLRRNATILLPLLIFCICNWACTTLFDGKGHLGDIYMGSAYALAPYPLIQIPIIIISNLVTRDEVAFYTIFNTISILWCGMLIFMAMMMIHQYGFFKTLLFTFFTIFGMLVFIFIVLLFFSMISQGVAYFISLGREVIFRLN